MDDKILLRIDALLKHIDQVLEDTKDIAVEELENSNLLLRATCFSIAQIGEMMNQLEKNLSGKYANLPWAPAKKMRNIIVHDYGGTDVEQIFSTIHIDLPILKQAFLAIKNDIVTETLITNRLVLRKIRKEDVESIFQNWARDPEVSKYLTWSAHKSLEDTKKIVDLWLKEYNNPKTIRYGIVLKDSNELIGSIDVVDYVDGKPEIGYCLSRKYWNNGYMTEVCDRFVKYLFDIGFSSIVIEADERNIGSNKVIQKCGFVFTHKETKPCSSFKPYIITVNWYLKNK